jgi:hypothetical protein
LTNVDLFWFVVDIVEVIFGLGNVNVCCYRDSMLVTDFTRQSIAFRRQQRVLLADGYEEVGEGGGKLWELYRGYRTRQSIKDVKIATHGKSLFVKIS